LEFSYDHLHVWQELVGGQVTLFHVLWPLFDRAPPAPGRRSHKGARCAGRVKPLAAAPERESSWAGRRRMTEIDFYKLSRPIQDGLLDSLPGQFTPAPILRRPGTRHDAAAWVAVSSAAALGLLLLSLAGFGNAESPLSLQPWASVAAYVLLAGT